MGSWKETATVYECGIMSGNTAPDTGSGMISRSAGKENVIPEKNRMGLVQALMILHKVRKIDKLLEQIGIEQCGEAFDVVFEWIDNMVLLLHKIGDRHDQTKTG